MKMNKKNIRLYSRKFKASRRKKIYLQLNFYLTYKIIISILIIYVLKTSYGSKNIIKKEKSAKIEVDQYFACFCSMGKKENLYARELIEYYINIGFDKFIFGDNNIPSQEKLSDVLQDYIKNKTVDIIEIFDLPIGQAEFFGNIYKKYNLSCKWISFFDFDEYLEMHSESGKIIGLKEFLSNPIFDNCESISFNWLMYSDNNLLHYDKRPLIERFPVPNNNDEANKFVKSIIRGNINKIPFFPKQSSHKPDESYIQCDSNGQTLDSGSPDCIEPPRLDKAYLKHFNTKTAEEYVEKIKKGNLCHEVYDIEERIQCFFSHNEYSDEKLKIFENAFNKNLEQNKDMYKSLYNK